MSFLGSVLSFLPPLLIGIALVYLILPNHSESMIAIKLFWSVGVGLGACSLLFFLWCLIFSPDQPGYLILEIGILVILGYFFFRKLKCEFKRFILCTPGDPRFMAIMDSGHYIPGSVGHIRGRVCNLFKDIPTWAI